MVKRSEEENAYSSLRGDLAENRVWAGIEAAGPREDAVMFDPVLVDDVISAERATAQYDRRKSFVGSYAWAVPTRMAIERIREAVGSRKLLEVCAGTGLWAKLLSDAGASVVATDGSPPPISPHFPIECVDAEEAVRRHVECRALMLCWPPFKDDCAFRALRVFEGDRVIYIGDVRFTADQLLHAALETSWQLIEQVLLPSWPGTLDYVHLYARREDTVSTSFTNPKVGGEQ